MAFSDVETCITLCYFKSISEGVKPQRPPSNLEEENGAAESHENPSKRGFSIFKF